MKPPRIHALGLALALLLPSSAAGLRAEKRWEHRVVELDDSRHSEEFWSFVTRPDLDAPRWQVTVYDEAAVTPGYWFVAPYEEVSQVNGSAAWNAPHIYDATGELIWSGAPTFHGFSTFDFRVSQVQGKPMLSLIRPVLNSAVVLDETYNIYKNVDIGHTDPGLEEMGLNMHEFMTIDDGARALFLTCVPKLASKEYSAAVDFDGTCHATYDGFVEMDTETWEPIYEWNAYDHIGLDESYVTQDPVEDRCQGGSWDFLHLNSIDKFPDGDYLISGRRTSTIYKVSGSDGSILWRLGGRKSDFDLPIVFSGQHAAKIYSHNDSHTLISFLDNAYGPGDPQTTNDASRALLLSLDTMTMKAEVVHEYKHPHHEYAEGQGNVQWLEETGHVWTCWQGRALNTEHSLDGSLIMEAQYKAGVRNYRSFKHQWVGKPSDPPDVSSGAVQSSDGVISTIVSMSWNGATEVREWHVYSTNPTGSDKDLVAKVKRTGFETTTWIEGYISHVVVEAIDASGEKLGESNGAATVPTLADLAEAASSSWSFAGMFKNPIVLFLLGMLASAAVFLGAYSAVVSTRNLQWATVKLPLKWQRQRQSIQTYRSVPEGEVYEFMDESEDNTENYSSSSREGGSSASANRKSVDFASETQGMIGSKNEV